MVARSQPRLENAPPRPGASSPIIVDGRVFVTCYSGYGLTQEDPGDIDQLMRHLVCVDLATVKSSGRPT